MSGHLTLTMCEGCMWDSHFDEVTPHSWMGPEDIEHAKALGQTIPSADKLADERPCNCKCAGGPGRHIPLAGNQAAELIAAADQARANARDATSREDET